MPGFRVRPWRSVRLPQAVTFVALVVGLPLYLRTPLWCDITLYDVAARNLLWGGAHYRDVFDTNLPGFVWILTAVRWAFGFGAVAARCVDLAFVTAIVYLIDRLAKRGGATLATRWWAIAAVAVLYPSAVEMAHVQRDTWMLLPAVAAVLVRLRRTTIVGISFRRAFAFAFLEGFLWGAAVWIKPHCVLMAAGVWLLTAWRVAGATGSRRAGFTADVLGNLAGGLAIGVAGVAAVIAGGSWPGFWEVLTVWAPDYAALARRELEMRYDQELHWFPPWSLWIIPSVPLALLTILDAVPWIGRPGLDANERPGPLGRLLPAVLWDRQAGSDARFARGAVAMLYLVWAVQSFTIQRGFMYAHMAELFLMFGLWASHRYSMPALVLLWLTLTSSAWLIADYSPLFRARMFQIARHDARPASDPDYEHYVIRHPLADARRLRLWPECWRINMTDRERYNLWDRLKRITEHEAAFDWEELEEVAEYLRAQGVKDGELIAWHDSPHALYLMLNVKPGLRYMHINTVQAISPEAKKRVQAELAATASVSRFAVSDLEYTTLGFLPPKRLIMLGPIINEEDMLPVLLDRKARALFPFNQKVVYRTRGGKGRYVVHELVPPLGDTKLR